MDGRDDTKLKEKRLKEKRRVIRINEAYKKLYAAMNLNGAAKRKISRNALLRATLDYITTLQSRGTDTVSRYTQYSYLRLDGLCTEQLIMHVQP